MRFVLAVVLCLLTTPTFAATYQAVCIGKKLTAVAIAAGKVFGCRADGLTQACIAKPLAGLEKKLAQLDEKGQCANQGADPVLVQSMLPSVDDHFGPVLGAGPCAEQQWKALAHKVKDDLKAYAKSASRPDADVVAAKRAKNATRFVKDFAHALTIGGCQATDAAYVSERADTLVTEITLQLLGGVCGDNELAYGEQCDGTNLGSCAACTATCACFVCGNGVTDPGETCDGADDAACPGACEADCGCAGPVVCGDGDANWPESCDGHPGSCFGNVPSPACDDSCQCCSSAGCSDFWDCCPGYHCINIVFVPRFGNVGDCVPD